MLLLAPPHSRPFRTFALASLLATALVAAGLGSTAVAQNAPRRCQIVGTDGPDVLEGTDGDDIICGLGGDDVIRGFGGNDEILGGDGNDQIFGGPGNDLIRGDDGTDSLFGGPGSDTLRGGNDADQLVGGPGDDVVRGGNDDDSLAGGTGNDVLRGGNGNDTARGASGNDVVFGGPGDDVTMGGAGNDRLRGGPGTDICQDTFPRTNSINCELGRGGDPRPIAISRQLWVLRGNAEFVYAMTVTNPCPEGEACNVSVFGETVHVRDGEAMSSFGAPAFTADELFSQAQRAVDAGRKVSFHLQFGLPTQIDNADGAALGVSEIELRDDLRAEFDAAKVRWQAAALDDYSFTVTTSCFCPFNVPIRVTVTNGTDVSTEPLTEGAPAWIGSAKTIDDHFDDFEELLDGRFISVVARFGPQLGVPLWVSVDESRLIADEGRLVRISDFERPAKPDPEEPEPDPAPAEVPVEEPTDDEPPAEPETPARVGPTIVSVRGIQVAEEIAEQLEALLVAADEAGLVLSGGGFRDPQRQIELRKKNCGTSDFAIFDMPASQCNPPTARPGQSQHELGLAIDFTNNGRLITSRNDVAFAWLDANAAAFGFINLPSEPWHWSTTGN